MYKTKWNDFLDRCQRFKRGYADSDVWDMKFWFTDTIKPMLIHLRDHGLGYPFDFDDRDQWCEILSEMIHCLDLMDEDNVYNSLGFCEPEDIMRMTPSDIENAREILKNSKDRFFELFVKHFYDLWD